MASGTRAASAASAAVPSLSEAAPVVKDDPPAPPAAKRRGRPKGSTKGKSAAAAAAAASDAPDEGSGAAGADDKAPAAAGRITIDWKANKGENLAKLASIALKFNTPADRRQAFKFAFPQAVLEDRTIDNKLADIRKVATDAYEMQLKLDSCCLTPTEMQMAVPERTRTFTEKLDKVFDDEGILSQKHRAPVLELGKKLYDEKDSRATKASTKSETALSKNELDKKALDLMRSDGRGRKRSADIKKMRADHKRRRRERKHREADDEVGDQDDERSSDAGSSSSSSSSSSSGSSSSGSRTSSSDSSDGSSSLSGAARGSAKQKRKKQLEYKRHRLMGGFVTTETLDKKLEKAIKKVEKRIDGKLDTILSKLG